MTRYFVLGNSDILVGLDKCAQVRDFYFPHIGQENHVNNKAHKIGVWVNGIFSWIDSGEWHWKRAYTKETLSTNILCTNKNLQLEITINDTVHHQKNIFIRRFIVKNLATDEREVRLFFHQDYTISEANIGDTVYYNPVIKSVIHYKGKRYFLMNGSVDGSGISEWATGLVGEYGMEGTYKDAENGLLSNNPIEHGSVDSVVGLYAKIKGKKSKDFFFWTCVGENFGEVSMLNDYIIETSPLKNITNTEKYWSKWVNRAGFDFMGLDKDVIDLFKRSLLIISTHVDRNGAIIASSDSEMLYLRKDTYNYTWPRDGALVARSLDRAGYNEITEHFFKFCKNVISKDGFLFHKYRPDGSLGSSWHSWLKHDHIQLPIQEDESALVIDAFWKNYLQHGKKGYVNDLHKRLVRKVGDFMLNFIDEKTGLPNETYDLWEEKLGIHTFTCATVYAGLKAAAKFEYEIGTKALGKAYEDKADTIRQAILKNLYDKERGYFIKSIYYDQDKLVKDYTLDLSSFYAIFEYGILDANDPMLESNINLIKERLLNKTSVGGYARYENDYYYRVDQGTPGNPWIITSLWLAEYYIKKAQTKEDLKPAIEIFKWVVSHALETGILPEQLNPHTGEPLSVAPLTWSHAGFVIAINKYLERLDSLGICKMCNPPKVRNNKKKKKN